MKDGRKYKYDWLIVGSGIFGATFAYYATLAKKSVFVIDRRSHEGGNVYCDEFNGVTVHKYGPHIFHTDNKKVWEFVNRRLALDRVPYSPIAITESGKVLPLPFNMYTFTALWDDVSTPEQAKARLAEQTRRWAGITPNNLEEKALSLVGPDIYEAMIKGYTEKQWGRKCTELPPEIIERVPFRFTYDNCYYNDRYVGIPPKGYNPLIETLLAKSEVELEVDYLQERQILSELAENILFTGCIDEFFDYKLGRLEYRSLNLDMKIRDLNETQGCAVTNHTGHDVPYTRVIEHNALSPKRYYEELVITREYPAAFTEGVEPYYPVIDAKNLALYDAYRELSKTQPNVHFGGRLGLFQYLDMDDAIEKAQEMAAELIR